MVVFTDGKSDRAEYRKFKMKTIEQQNDYGSMQETIFRRFSRAIQELPDLILVDGGIGHVNAVNEILKELSFDIEVVGMAKDDKHRTKALVKNDFQYNLSDNLILLRFITEIQDETHRVAVEYNRKLREKRYIHSELDDIEGIGAARKKALLRRFKSVSAIKNATVEQLQETEGISLKAAQKIYAYFRGGLRED